MKDPKPRIADVITWSEFGPSDFGMPEQKLVAAIIQRAVLDYYSTTRADKRARKSAIKFLFSDDPEQSRLRLYAELVFRDPDGFIDCLRRAVRANLIKPNKVVMSD